MGVPAYRFISAEPGQRYFEAGLIDGPADEVGIEAIHARTLHRMEKPCDVVVFQDGLHPLEAMSVVPRGPTCLQRLVGCPLSRYRQAVDVPAEAAADGRYSRRIHPPREQQRSRNVGAQVQVGRPWLDRDRAVGSDGPYLDTAVLSHHGDAVGRDGGDLPEGALIGGHRSEAQVPGNRYVVDVCAWSKPCQRPHLGPENQAAIR